MANARSSSASFAGGSEATKQVRLCFCRVISAEYRQEFE
jgi:hypothetical protein